MGRESSSEIATRPSRRWFRSEPCRPCSMSASRRPPRSWFRAPPSRSIMIPWSTSWRTGERVECICGFLGGPPSYPERRHRTWRRCRFFRRGRLERSPCDRVPESAAARKDGRSPGRPPVLRSGAFAGRDPGTPGSHRNGTGRQTPRGRAIPHRDRNVGRNPPCQRSALAGDGAAHGLPHSHPGPATGALRKVLGPEDGRGGWSMSRRRRPSTAGAGFSGRGTPRCRATI